MPHPFFERHQALLENACEAVATRGHWSPYPEVPSKKIYGETANQDGKAAFEGHLGKLFMLPHSATSGVTGQEASPYGIALDISYPKLGIDGLLEAAARAGREWRLAGPQTWAGVALEILHRLNQRSFEMAYAVMHTTGQAYVMAFQAGGPHAQDRGLEAVAWAWRLIGQVPATAQWEKPQGKHAPLRMEKQYKVVPRGIALVIGCSTFPTWNSYPGLFASLATGNTVVVKPHPGAILPLALTVQIAREVLQEAGFDPNVVTLAPHDHGDDTPTKLATRPEIRIVDFTGSTANGVWLEQNARQAQVYTEKAGVNQIIIDSTDDLNGLARNIAFSLSLYSGQMCTAPQNIYIPAEGINTPTGHVGPEAVTAAIVGALSALTADSAMAVDVLGALQNEGVEHRVARARQLGKILLDSQPLLHPDFPAARVRTPLLLQVPAAQEGVFMQEHFGPISFVIYTNNTAHSIELAQKTVREHGALTLSLYSLDRAVIDQVRDMAEDTGVALSINLTSGVFVNQSAAFSDFHGTGANAAANAALTDAAFVANRFRIVQSRTHI